MLCVYTTYRLITDWINHLLLLLLFHLPPSPHPFPPHLLPLPPPPPCPPPLPLTSPLLLLFLFQVWLVWGGLGAPGDARRGEQVWLHRRRGHGQEHRRQQLQEDGGAEGWTVSHIHFSGQFDLKLDIFECLVSHVAFKYVLMSAFWLINPLQACDRRPSESQEV